MPTDLDQSKRGLQDDHDPSDLGQKQNDKLQGDFKPPKQPASCGPTSRSHERGF